MTHEILQRYRRLRDSVDRQAERLFAVHSAQIQCRQKCTDCCINLTVWPVEFYAILEELKAAGVKPVFDANAGCGFLKDGLCQLYPFRPIICRTHGLPLVYLDETQDEPVYGVTFCEKNFQNADDLAFGADTTLNMDEVNECLARQQTEFSAVVGNEDTDDNGRIALARLIDFLGRS